MQFIHQGPDVPERLLQAHEDGRVVFFCGAGISYPASLPGFAGLVKRLYQALGTTPSTVQQAAIKAGQLDTAIALLEADIIGSREAVRRKLAEVLTPNLSAPNATATHDALLTLGKCRNGHTRLITTNFDRLFEEVIARKSLIIERFQAPLLPPPKNRWDGLVYLHGLLSDKPTQRELDRLVISSGDFGLAYLTERWAARFVSELFHNYTVCFVGYSINDPVLRYMMDALAADRLLGESPPEMFAFGSFSKGKEQERANEWRAKNVTPILYREHYRHAYLHKTLQAWAKTYRDGKLFPMLTNQKLNSYLKEIADICGIKKNLTFHLARHTFATMSLSKGVPIESVSKMLGHTNIKTTQIYARITNKKIEHDMDELADKLGTFNTALGISSK